MATAKPSELELQVLSVLWEIGPATVRQLRAAMPDGKQRAYTTVLSVVQVMEKKGLLVHDRQGLAHVYRPAVKRETVLRPILRDLTRNVFGGSAARVMQFLLAGSQVSREELADIRKLLANMDGPAGGGSAKGGRS